MNIWFTSDFHLDHANIIKFTNRPFSSCREMNEIIIQRHNERVKDGDHVYNCGDFCMSRDWKRWNQHLWKLKGKIHLIRGNHDRPQTIKKLEAQFEVMQKLVWVKDYYKLTVQDKKNQEIILMHYAMRVWDKAHYGTLHCYGHSHGGLPEDPIARSMDVGVDTNNFYPYHYEEIRDRLLKKPGYLIKRKSK